jgi:hypothetical protein
VAEKWRRCDSCRKVKPVADFTAEEPTCQVCQSPPVRSGSRTAGRAANGQRVTPGPAGGAAGGDAAATTVSRVATIAPRDLVGRGDPEVRARRARVRALDRLAERHAEDFAALLDEERRAERL